MRSKTTTREYLLDVAVSEFATHGFRGTSLRSIARAADVSPALYVHYFTNRELLIQEAIRSTLGIWIGEEKKALLKNPETRISDWVQFVKGGSVKIQFFRQVLLGGGEFTDLLFKEAVIEARHMLDNLRESDQAPELEDPDATAALLTSQALANLIFLPQIEAALGGPISDEEIALKLFKAQQGIINISLTTKKGN